MLDYEMLITGPIQNEVNAWYQMHSEALLQMEEGLDFLVKNDFMQSELVEVFGDHAARYSWGSFFLYRNNPMLPSLIIQNFITESHLMGTELGGDQGSVMTAIHLYNAARQSEHILKSIGKTPFLIAEVATP
jgi:hypothetical protein